MPQQKKQYEDALGSVFDFIFEESQKPPNKVKPVKVTGVDGSSEMVDALTAVLENPLLYVNKTTMEAFNNAFDVDVGTVSVGKRVPDNIKFNLGELKKLMENPSTYIDAQYKKIEGIRKQQRIAWAGEEMRGIVGYMWAKKYGLDKDTQEAMVAAGRGGKVDEFTKKPIGMRTQYDTFGVTYRNEKLAQRYLDPNSREFTRQEFRNMFGGTLGDAQADMKWNQYRKWRQSYSTHLSNNNFEKIRDELLVNRELYTVLEKANLSKKSVDARMAGDMDKAEKYQRASDVVANVYDQTAARAFRNKLEGDLNSISNAISQLQRSNDPDKHVKIRELKNSMRSIQGDIRMSRFEDFAGQLGQWEGMYYSAKDLFIDGNLMGNILNGKFFADKYNQINWLQPSKEQAFTRRGHSLKIHAAKEATNRFQQAYFDKMNSVYYLSPAAWVKTLIDGEGFGYLAYRSQEKFKKQILGEISNFDWTRFLAELEKGDDAYVRSLAGRVSTQQMEMIDKFLKKDARLSNLYKTFGTISRIRDKIDGLINKHVLSHVRNAVGKVLLLGIKNSVAVALVKDWMLKGGVQTLVKGITTAISSALGVVGTPIAGLISFLASELVYKLSQPLMKMSAHAIKIGVEGLVYFLAGIVALAGFVIIFGSSLLGVHSHVAPFEVVSCGAPDMIDEIDPTGTPVGKEDMIGQLLGGDYQEIFDSILERFGLSGVSLTFVDDGTFSSTYSEWAWCVARYNGIICNSSKAGSAGLSYFQGLMVHEVTHLVQYRSGGLNGNPLGMEVGAEIISGNYGGYKFHTIDGVKSGTQIRDAMLSRGYDQQTLEDWSKGISSSGTAKLDSEIKSYVKGFAR
jgi:hypothetical protein